MLLHSHYMQPFSRVNGLEKLANTDDYQMIVSYDDILKQILSPSDNLTKLDGDKQLWNQFEACSTLGQLEKTPRCPYRSEPSCIFLRAAHERASICQKRHGKGE